MKFVCICLGILLHFGHLASPSSAWARTDNNPNLIYALYQPVEIEAQGPICSSLSGCPGGQNPFLDYRYFIDLITPNGNMIIAEGFFDGDGNGGSLGNTWKVRFTPEHPGNYTFRVHFYQGNVGQNIAVNLSSLGTPYTGPHNSTGTFSVTSFAYANQGFHSKGVLQYSGEHYLQFSNGDYFIKGGTDGPENFLAYDGFVNTVDQDGSGNCLNDAGLYNGLHRYRDGSSCGGGLAGHQCDDPGDGPNFNNGKSGLDFYDSKGIVGALHYLSTKKVNSVYMLLNNLGGDGCDTYPWNNPSTQQFFDLKKLHQWNLVFRYAMKKEIMLQLVLNETETQNELLYDFNRVESVSTAGDFSNLIRPQSGFHFDDLTQRKLFYREMMTRFGYLHAIKWNLSEENDLASARLEGNNNIIENAADFLQAIAYRPQIIAFHTHLQSNDPNQNHEMGYADYLHVWETQQNTNIVSTSLQLPYTHAAAHIEYWFFKSEPSGTIPFKLVIDNDEQSPAGVGVTDSNADDRRVRTLWPVLLSGGNIEWYLGYHSLPLGGDIRLENFRTREAIWNYTWYARKLLEQQPFWKMRPEDSLLSGENTSKGQGQVFRGKTLQEPVYLVYFPDSSATGQLNLSNHPNLPLRKTWYNPRIGQTQGSSSLVTGGGIISVGPPPGGYSAQDWVLILKQ